MDTVAIQRVSMNVPYPRARTMPASRVLSMIYRTCQLAKPGTCEGVGLFPFV